MWLNRTLKRTDRRLVRASRAERKGGVGGRSEVGRIRTLPRERGCPQPQQPRWEEEAAVFGGGFSRPSRLRVGTPALRRGQCPDAPGRREVAGTIGDGAARCLASGRRESSPRRRRRWSWPWSLLPGPPLSIAPPKKGAMEARPRTRVDGDDQGGVKDCAGRAAAATALSRGRGGGRISRAGRAGHSGVAFRLPPYQSGMLVAGLKTESGLSYRFA